MRVASHVRGRAVRAQGLFDLTSHAQQRVERAHGVLVDHGDVAAADLAKSAVVDHGEILAVEQHFAA